MDYASSQHNKCPFQGDPSQISFMVLTGKVEYGKIDNFGMALALGKKVPYNDLDIRDNLENIARKWKPYSQVTLAVLVFNLIFFLCLFIISYFGEIANK